MSNRESHCLEAPPDRELLHLAVQPGAIKHLGIKLYHRPADVVSELVANAWDADSPVVEILIDNSKKEIVVADKGMGMTYSDVQDCYLQMGRDRRVETGQTLTPSGRPVLGRKGIGKFSGLGIAKAIEIDTTSCITHERTVFEISPDFDDAGKRDLEDLISRQEWYDPDPSREAGTIVKLKGISNNLNDAMIERFRRSLSRRFLLSENVSRLPFEVRVNKEELPASYNEDKQYDFPLDLTEEERADLGIKEVDEDGWAIVEFKEYEVAWRIGYSEKPIKDEELRGIAIFAHGKLAQSAFFFDQQGGSSADLAKEYITGRIKMDFVDEELDLISPERQRLQLEDGIGEEIKQWGLSLLSKLNNIWKRKRATHKIEAVLNDPADDGARKRIEKLTGSEQKIINNVLRKIASSSPKSDDEVFKIIANDLITAYEKGRLRRLIDEIDGLENVSDSAQILKMVAEAGILADLQIGEAIKTKIEAIAQLREMIAGEMKENDVRDFLAEHPWIINPNFESYKRETSVYKTIQAVCDGRFFEDDEVYDGRIDLMLTNSFQNEFILLEFMRPGKKLDEDHVRRIDRYVFDIREHLKQSSTCGELQKRLSHAWIVAECSSSAYVQSLLEDYKGKSIYFVNWDTFLQNGLANHRESLAILKDRNMDPRIEAL